MWFLIALILGALVGGLLLWMRSRSMSLTWYEWVIGVIGLLMVLFGVQNYFGSVAEVELNAAPMYLLVVALPGLVLLAIAGFLAYRRQGA
jgi:uncharacterized membrane protein